MNLARMFSFSSPSGGIGIRAGLKNQWPLGRVGSTPTSGTVGGLVVMNAIPT